MAKKTTPIITHVEILHLAIRQLETEIENQRSLLAGIPEGEAFLAQYRNERLAKINALKSIYLIETGTKYD